MDKNSLQLLLSQGLSVERIAKRFGKDPSTVSYWMKKHGLVSSYRERHAAKGGIERERLGELVADGRTISEIAAEVGLSKGAVRHWMRVYGFRTARARETPGGLDDHKQEFAAHFAPSPQPVSLHPDSACSH